MINSRHEDHEETPQQDPHLPFSFPLPSFSLEVFPWRRFGCGFARWDLDVGGWDFKAAPNVLVGFMGRLCVGPPSRRTENNPGLLGWGPPACNAGGPPYFSSSRSSISPISVVGRVHWKSRQT
jgi:hypothetical protein